jgi:predicted Zn-dependent peptidase
MGCSWICKLFFMARDRSSTRGRVTPLAAAVFLVVVVLAASSEGRAADASALTAAPGSSSPSAVIQFQLANGLQVVLQPEPASRDVVVAVGYAVGSADDPQGYGGLAHLAEHLTFRGSRHLHNFQSLGLLERAGATFNGLTFPEDTVFVEEAPARQLETLLWIESERMAFAVEGIDEEGLRREKRVVTSERAERGEGLQAVESEVNRALYPPGHPFRSSEDPKGDLDAIPVSAVQRFMQAAYRPDHARLVIVGGFEPAAARALVERFYTSVRSAPVPPVGGVVAPPPATCGIRRLVFNHRYAYGSFLSVKWPIVTPLSTSDDVALGAMERALMRRLQYALLEQQKRVSSVNVASVSYRSHGFLHAEVELLEYDGWPAVESIILAEGRQLAAQPISVDAMQSIRGRMTMRLMESYEHPARRAIQIARRQRIVDLDSERAAIGALTPADIQNMARRLSPGPLVVRILPSRLAPEIVSLVSSDGACR